MNQQWHPPGPGAWELEKVHFSKPITKFVLEKLPPVFEQAFKQGTAKYGLLLSHFKVGIVNGFWYQQAVAFGAPEGATGSPPKAVLWLLTRLHPAIRKRIAISAKVFADKQWRKDLHEWDTIDKPNAIKTHLELCKIDLTKLNDEELVENLKRVSAHGLAMVALHHKYTMPVLLAVGDYLAHAQEWTGLDLGMLTSLLRGTSKISLGVANEELQEAANAIRDNNEAKQILNDPAISDEIALDQLRNLPGKVGETLQTFLDLVRWRLVGFDICDKTYGELPQVSRRALQRIVEHGSKSVDDPTLANRETHVRERVPVAYRTMFDALLAEARLINRLRDERGVYSDGWGTGILRRTVLEAGRRLHSRGLIHEVEHAVDLYSNEMFGLLTKGQGPSADELAERVQFRLRSTVNDMPSYLGAEPGNPPSPDILPPPAQRAAKAINVLMGTLFVDSTRKNDETILRGISVNEGIYEGTARLVSDSSDFSKIQQGDVLVTRATSAYFNGVLPMLGAIVTDRGGQLCHAAIVAREYGIPGIVGTREATIKIKDGARVRVDGAKGEVTVLSNP